MELRYSTRTFQQYLDEYLIRIVKICLFLTIINNNTIFFFVYTYVDFSKGSIFFFSSHDC